MSRRPDPFQVDAEFLALRRAGLSFREIAARCGVSYRRAWQGVQEARLREHAAGASTRPRPEPIPKLTAITPAVGLTPQSTCSHARVPLRGPYYCVVCDRIGAPFDAHWSLRRDPSTDPGPEPKP